MPDAYAPIAALWLLVVVAAEMPLTALRLAWLVPAWLALCIVAPLGKDAPDPGLTTRLIAGLLSQVLGIGMAAFVVWRNLRASRPARDTDPHESTGWEPALLDRDHPKPT